MVALLVILTICSFLVVDGIVQHVQARREAENRIPLGVQAVTPDDMRIPAGIFLGRNHTWVELEPTGVSKIGLDSFVQSLVGNIRSLVLPKVGREVKAGEPLFSLLASGRELTFKSPVTGTVAAVSRDMVEESMEPTVHTYGTWICKMVPKELSRDLGKLRIGEEASMWLKQELDRFQDFLSGQAGTASAIGVVAQDGGALTRGVLSACDEKVWDSFQENFLGGPSKPESRS